MLIIFIGNNNQLCYYSLKLTGSANYLFWKIYIKSTLTLITYSYTVFTAEDMNTSALFQTTDMDKIARTS